VTSGTPVEVESTSNLSLVISSGSTLGHTSGVNHPIYVYLINNAGTAELAASTILYPEGSVVTTTAEGGAGASDSNTAIYSTTARTNVSMRLIGRCLSNQVTAGTWALVPTEITPGVPVDVTIPRQRSLTVTGTNWTTARAVGIFYQAYDDDGKTFNWRMRFNISGTVSIAAAGISLTIANIVTKNVSNYLQQVTAGATAGTATQINAYISPNSNIIEVGFGATSTRFLLSGDIELDSAPTGLL
jgi:hypothetical protein